MGYLDLPLEVGTWLRPVHMAMSKSAHEKARAAARARHS
jgi:hypothetical protein